jgi:hypothetical protein
MPPLARVLEHPRRVLIQNHIVQAGEPVAPRDAAADLGLASATFLYHLRVLVAASAPIGFDKRGRARWIG